MGEPELAVAVMAGAQDLRLVVGLLLALHGDGRWAAHQGRAEAGGVLLALPSGEAWQFSAEPLRPELEDSAFFAAAEGTRRTTQIVLRLDTAATPKVRWRFERAPQAPAREAGRKSAAEPPPLP